MDDHKKRSEILRPGSLEWRLLVAVSRLELDDGVAREIKDVLRQPVDWDLVIHHSRPHGVVGLLYRHLTNPVVADLVPPQVIDQLKNNYMALTVLSMRQFNRFNLAAEALAAEDVEMITLKGAVLAEELYGDIGLRPLSDIDILVREEHWPAVFKVLKELGYSAAGKEFAEIPPKFTRYDVPDHMQYLLPDRTCLEFQFDLFTLGIGMLDIGGVWARSRPAVVAGARARVLSPEDQLLHLAVHANRHGCGRLKWLVDIAEFLRQNSGDLDWGLIAEIARLEKVTASVYSTLTHVERLFGERLIEPASLDKLKPAAHQQLLWKAVWPRKKLDRFDGRIEDGISFYFYRFFDGWNLINFAMMGRVKDKLAYQARLLVPSLSWMTKTYNKPVSLGLIKYYPIRVITRGLKKRGTQVSNKRTNGKAF